MVEPYLVLKNFGDLITADHKVLDGGRESRNSHRHAVVVQDLVTQWVQFYPCTTKNFSGDGKGVYESFSSRREGQKSFILTMLWNLANPLETDHGIIVHQHTIDLRRMVLLRRAVRRFKRRDVCCSVAIWLGRKNGWLIIWNASVVICEMFKAPYRNGKTPCERRCGEPWKGPVIPFGWFDG